MLRIQLGIELRRLREQADRSTFEAADLLGCKQPKISKIESGSQGVKPDEVTQLLDFYGATAKQRKYLLGLAERLPKRSRPKMYHRDAVPDWFQRFLALESDATEIKIYETELVTGLLQTEDYARSTIKAWEPAADPRLVERQVQTRLRRQEVLTRRAGPLKLHAVLSEAALHRMQGDTKTMLGQLEHLLAVSERPNITLQVLPFAVPNRIAVTSSVMLFQLREQELSAVYLEDFFGATYLWEPADYTRYSIVFERLILAALPVEESRGLIDRVTDKYRQAS
ncbi:helix-turn-helix domain-containing protein [Saccharopolyspora phatthalungensis]|uniref:Transcriptional regulator with XRE-family HTH domain n=1 Tax=Saccharopolyspora phatthalungensis TaxID=664693 RepID=A0A840QA93_9PSEU|nr:helix-turn-helix transcriptional regulator [Saccharopolyspora phatthalungensis]MBB5156671.1 transcriptional regulator with XRE-family HTH domain [Saccharopolyspora phatthalungensis]